MHLLNTLIVRFVDEAQPGWGACEFEDAYGRRHTVIDKIPVLTSLMLDAESTYPQPATIICEILQTWSDSNGRDLVRIRTDSYGINSTDGLSEFVVLSSQLSTA